MQNMTREEAVKLVVQTAEVNKHLRDCYDANVKLFESMNIQLLSFIAHAPDED